MRRAFDHPRAEADPEKIALESTRERDRTAERVGWFTSRSKVAIAVSPRRDFSSPVSRKISPDLLQGSDERPRVVYIGRYLDLDQLDDGGYLVDFNVRTTQRATFSPHYNCPVPPA